MKRFSQVLGVCLGLYLLYTVKSALGIDISHRYHAIDLVRIPTRFAVHKVKAWVAPPIASPCPKEPA